MSRNRASRPIDWNEVPDETGGVLGWRALSGRMLRVRHRDRWTKGSWHRSLLGLYAGAALCFAVGVAWPLLYVSVGGSLTGGKVKAVAPIAPGLQR